MKLLSLVRWQTAVDFFVLAMGFYFLLLWARSARALRIALGVVGLHALSLLARRLDLIITSLLLDFLAILAVILLLLVFQPELRRMFMGLDSALRRLPLTRAAPVGHYREIATACFELASAYVGALIVIVRKDSITELLEAGVTLGAEISTKLLKAIFQKDSPLHDGAVIIERDHISKANVVLPLTHGLDVPSAYGTRHRAAIGLAERCDALVIAVSEERGYVTLMEGKSIYHMKSVVDLVAAFESLGSGKPESVATRIHRTLFSNPALKLGALGLATLIWSMSFLAAGTTIRTLSLPVEFSNVPTGMEIAQQSVDTLEVQVRGSSWIMDSVSLANRIARFNLGNMGPGWHQLALAPSTLNLPPGVIVDQTTPAKMRVRLERTGAGPK